MGFLEKQLSEKQPPFYSEQNSWRNEINIYRIDDRLIKTFPTRPFKPNRNNYQAIIWFNAGSGSHLIDDQLYDVEPNTFMLVTKDQMHAFNPKSGIRGCAIRFSDSFLDSATYHSTCKYSLFNNLTVNSVLKVNETEKPAFETLVLQLLNEYEKEDELGKFDIIQHYLEALIIKLDQLKKKQFTRQYDTNNSTYLIFQTFNFELEKYFKTYHDVSSYSARLNISHRKLSDVLKLFVGKSTLEVIQERIVTEAKRSLMYSGQTIQEIAFELGFEDPFYFSKVFKKVTGQAPKAFRVKLQKFT